MKKPRILKRARWLFWANGMVIYPFLIVRTDKSRDVRRTYRHELEHWYQIDRLGVCRFYWNYFWKYLRYGYKKHPYEVEAREASAKELTEHETRWWLT